MVMRRRRLELFGHVRRRDETENIRAVAEIKGKLPSGRPKLKWKYTVNRDLKVWNIGEEWATDSERCSPGARGGNLAKIPPNQVIDDFGRGSSVES